MKTYTVYINPKREDPYEDAQFVPEGFSVIMFLPIINVFIAAYRRCWWLLLAIVGIETLTFFASQNAFFNASVFASFPPWKLYMALRLALLFFFGLWVNDFWRAKLEKRGYEIADIVAVPSGFRSGESAQQRFYGNLEALK